LRRTKLEPLLDKMHECDLDLASVRTRERCKEPQSRGGLFACDLH
jgi:hypothetical protein